VNENLHVDYAGTAEGMVASGRNQAWELNCVACHRIDGNVPVINQFIQKVEGGSVSFDEVNAPPWLRGQGAKVQHDWFYGFLNDVVMLRPWLKVRMPSFHLDNAMSTTLVEYFVGLSQEESDWLAGQLKPVEQYIAAARAKAEQTRLASGGAGRTPRGEGDDESGGGVPAEEDGLGPGWSDWMAQQDLERNAHLLAGYAIRNRLAQPTALDPTESGEEEIAETMARVIGDAQFLRDLYDVAYPFTEMPPSAHDEWKAHLADGETIFMTLECLKCHVFGDPSLPGANSAPTAPNLQLTSDRLRREWVKGWLASPMRIQPGTQMPNWFGQGDESAFKDFPEEDRQLVKERLFDEGLLNDGPAQMTALTDWMFDGGKKHLDEIQIPVSAIPPAAERDLTKDLEAAAPTTVTAPGEEAAEEEGAEDEGAWPGEEAEGETAEDAGTAEDAAPEESDGGGDVEGWGDEESAESSEGAEKADESESAEEAEESDGEAEIEGWGEDEEDEKESEAKDEDSGATKGEPEIEGW
jgi:hypothetical protein